MCFINTKKVCLSLILLSFAISLNADYVSKRSESFVIQAGYGGVTTVMIDEIPAQSMQYIAGMPFDIEEAIVQYASNPESGRRIARFSMLSNQDFTITFDGEPMRLVKDGVTQSGENDPELYYILYFDCQLGYYVNGEIQTADTTDFIYRSANGTASWNPGLFSDDGTFIGNVNGYIYFMFDSQTSSFISSSTDASLPPGNYEANVVVTIKTDEGGSTV